MAKNIKNFLITLIRGYQTIGGALRVVQPPITGIISTCRFYPTCSDYAITAIEKYGPVMGTAKAAGRICRCHPFSAGGVDFP